MFTQFSCSRAATGFVVGVTAQVTDRFAEQRCNTLARFWRAVHYGVETRAEFVVAVVLAKALTITHVVSSAALVPGICKAWARKLCVIIGQVKVKESASRCRQKQNFPYSCQGFA